MTKTLTGRKEDTLHFGADGFVVRDCTAVTEHDSRIFIDDERRRSEREGQM